MKKVDFIKEYGKDAERFLEAVDLIRSKWKTPSKRVLQTTNNGPIFTGRVWMYKTQIKVRVNFNGKTLRMLEYRWKDDNIAYLSYAPGSHKIYTELYEVDYLEMNKIISKNILRAATILITETINK